MTEAREPDEPETPDVRNDPVPEPVRTEPLPGDDDGSTIDHSEGD